MSILDNRNSTISTVTEFTKGIDEISALMTVGDGVLAPADLRMTALVPDGGNVKTAYAMMNYYVVSELHPTGSKGISRSEQSTVKQYTVGDITLTVQVCTLAGAGAPQWCRVLFDNAGLTDGIGCKVDEDRLADEDTLIAQPMEVEDVTEPEEIPAVEEPAPQEEEPMEDDGISAVIIPTEEPAAPVESVVTEVSHEDKSEEDKYWDYVTAKIKAAQRAIASGAAIRANETISLLRHMLIELICVRNGITDNFEHSIDFVECEEKNLLMKTYPASLEPNALAAALGVVSELFDRLG